MGESGTGIKKGDKNEFLLKLKFFLDKTGYGFSATQFINILFSFTGASLLLIGLVNGLKSAASTILSSFLKEISEKGVLSRKMISISGLSFGFSFLFMAFSVSIKSPELFAASLLLGTFGIVSYGDLYNKFIRKYVEKAKFSILAPKFAFYGLIITTISILLSGYIMDIIPMTGKLITFTLFGNVFEQKIYGYLISFELTAFAFIISSYVLAKIKVEEDHVVKDIYAKQYFINLFKKLKVFLTNKYLLVLSLSTIFIAIFQSSLNSYMGIYIYNFYKDMWLGGFLNVAVMYAAALLASLFGPLATSKMNKNFGIIPMFVFGALLLALLPLIVVYNQYFPAIILANVFSVLGAAILGSAHGLLAGDLLNENDRKTYYTSSGLMTVIPFIIGITILSIVANNYGLLILFKYLSIGILVSLVPLFFLMVFWVSKKQ